MKTLKYITLLLVVAFTSCSDIIDQYPENYLNTGTFYNNATEMRTALNGCYNSLQASIKDEWQLTELRSDNAIMSSPGTTSIQNFDLDYLDRYYPNTSQPFIEAYWKNSYYTVKSTNLVLNSLGANYNKSAGVIELSASVSATLTDAERKNFTAEACFLRAMQYYNLVRIYGGVFLIDEPISPVKAKEINRSSVADIYKFIVADLVYASANGSNAKYSAASATLGLANSWAAKAMLAKVYLNLNKKADAIPLLNDVLLNSGYGLETSYANVFSIENEMNKEILFAVRYKTGGLNLGNSIPNFFAPLNSGNSVIIGGGNSYNTPSQEFIESYSVDDVRKIVNIAQFNAIPRPDQIYVNKFISKPTIKFDAENDWPVIRFADVKLMLAEAQGNTASSWAQINDIHKRAFNGVALTPDLSNTAVYEKALADERRWEFAFENQRLFDLLRFETTLSTIKAEKTLDDHFAYMYPIYYIQYTEPRLSLEQMQANTNADKFLLPIPQYEIDTNSFIVIPQNPGY